MNVEDVISGSILKHQAVYSSPFRPGCSESLFQLIFFLFPVPERQPPEPVLQRHRGGDGGVLPESQVRASLRTHSLLPCHQPRRQVGHHNLA